MKKFMASKSLFTVLLLAMIFSSCRLQKRIYTKGFYASKHETVKKPEAKDTTLPIALALKNIKQFAKENYVPLFAQLNKTHKSILTQTCYKNFVTDGCDTILFKDGTVRVVKIKKLERRTIGYSTCYSNDTLVEFITRKNIKAVHFANGRVETRYVNPKNYIKQPTSKWAVIGLLLTLAGIAASVLLFTIFSPPTLVGVIIGVVAALFLASLILNITVACKIKRADNPRLTKALVIINGIISILFILAVLLILFVQSLHNASFFAF